MKIMEWLRQAEDRLTTAGVATARLDALVLLEDTTGRNRALLLAHPEKQLAAAREKILEHKLVQRERHVPLAYIRGKSEFYGRDFVVNEHVLEPRPESETMIEMLKALAARDRRVNLIADIGSGSGALGITGALELGLKRADFFDIDPMTLRVARVNAARYEVLGKFYEGDLFEKHQGVYDVVLANLPYVPDDFHINEGAGHEPAVAIFGGPDGLDVYRKLFVQAAGLPVPPRYILTEALPPSHETLALLGRRYGYEAEREEDFIQAFVRGAHER